MLHSGPPPIQDRFTALPISRQRKYQLRRKAKQLCSICGKARLFRAERCRACNAKFLKHQRDQRAGVEPKPFGARKETSR